MIFVPPTPPRNKKSERIIGCGTYCEGDSSVLDLWVRIIILLLLSSLCSILFSLSLSLPDKEKEGQL